MVYKSVNNQAPTYLMEIFIRLSDSCKKELRITETFLQENSSLSYTTMLHKQTLEKDIARLARENYTNGVKEIIIVRECLDFKYLCMIY